MMLTSQRPFCCHNFHMLVLASASPRRRELLTQAGYAFTVYPAHIPEEPRRGEDPVAYVTRLAVEKAEVAFRQLATTPEVAGLGGKSPIIVLGADTTVTIDNQILGKPEDAADAERMLRMLSGRSHRVITGVALVDEAGADSAAEITTVEFRAMTEKEIRDYVASGEPMDKAGAYAIQGRAARWIPRIEGCYFNVVGLPLARVAGMLERRGHTGILKY
jgi:septum formation protein